MTDSPSSEEAGPDRPDPFEQRGGSDPGAPRSFDSPGPSGEEDPLSSAKVQASFAINVARAWVEDHQKATMLGAFATGVVLGALFRD